MGKCIQCGYEQEEGKFCGQCGGPLVAATKVQQQEMEIQNKEIAMAQEVGTIINKSESLDRVKESTKTFGTYFKLYLKKPSLIFANKEAENELNNGIISIILASFLLAIVTYTSVYNAMREYYAYFDKDDLPPFIEIFGNAILYNFLIIAIIVFLLFLINKLFGTGCTFKEIISIYGAHTTPAIVLAALSLIFLVIKSQILGGVLFFVTVLFMISITPVYVINSLVTRRSKGIDPYYGYIAYLVAVVITFIVFASKFPDSSIAYFLTDLFDF